MDPRLYIIMRRDLWDMNPGKAVAHGSHATNDFECYVRNVNSDELNAAVAAWRENRNFGVALALHEPLDTMELIRANTMHSGMTTDPTYPYRNHYGELFTCEAVTCMWAFVYTEEEVEFMRGFRLHQ